MATYDRFVTLAVKLISKWGMPLAIRREEDVLNPDDGSVKQAPVMEQDAVGVFVPNQWGQDRTWAFLPGELVQATDRQMVVAAPFYDFDPEPGDQVHLSDGTDYDIVALVPIDPGGSAIVYKLLLRG